MKLPFWAYPGHWGLKGRTLEHAKVDYLHDDPYTRESAHLEIDFTGVELAKQRLELDRKYNKVGDYDYFRTRSGYTFASDSIEYQKYILDLDLEYGKITEVQYEDGYIALLGTEEERVIATLDALRKRGEITELEYAKETATRMEVPWFNLSIEYASGELELEVDWNQYFIAMLREVGYTGHDDEEIIDSYVKDTGKQLGESEYDIQPADMGYTFVKSTLNGTQREYQ